ncbi:DUF2711 family protein [Priestia aryabhattai]
MKIWILHLWGSTIRFITLLLAKDTNIEDTIKSLNLEALICDKATRLNSFI